MKIWSRRECLAGAGAVAVAAGVPAQLAAKAVMHHGVKVISLLVPRKGIPIETFRHEWLGVHAAAAPGIPNIKGFVLSELAADRPSIGLASIPSLPFIAGMSESWWDSVAARDEARASAPMKKWVEHGNSIIDRARSLTFILRDHVFIPPRPLGKVKRVGLMRRKDGTSRDECMRYWLAVHAPMHEVVPNLQGFVVSELLEPNAPRDFDGVVETWWESAETRRRSLATPAGVAWNDDGRSYLDFPNSRGFLTREHVILPRPGPYW